EVGAWPPHGRYDSRPADNRTTDLPPCQREKAVGTAPWSVCAASGDGSGITRRLDRQTDVAAASLHRARDVGPTLLLHNCEPGSFHVEKLDGNTGAASGREEGSAASLSVYRSAGVDPFTVDHRCDTASLSDVGPSS